VLVFSVLALLLPCGSSDVLDTDGEFAVENISAVAGGIHVGLEFWEPELPPLVMCKGELTIKPAVTTVAS